MTATELTYDIPYNPPVPLKPKPQACREPTVAAYTIVTETRENGFRDTWVLVMRSCAHGPYNRGWRIPWVLPVIGEEAMSCGGPPVVTAESGRADKSQPPLKKGKRWARLKSSKVS